MAYSVLILDDDVDFNSLLTDIFEQADYVVTSLEDPVEAIEVFRETDYDLVVTDHKMPEMTGAEFMKRIKKMKPHIPVIMVSGYLENDTIRELISEGVGGVFLKPLNIFSLLERTSELIEESKKAGESSSESEGDGEEKAEAETHGAQLDFNFRSFPCKSENSVEFAEKLYNLRNFKSTLSLIGPSGSRYRGICEDIRGFYESDKEQFVYFSESSFDETHALSSIEAASNAGAERVTCVLLHLEAMDDAQKKLAVLLAKSDGAFEGVETDLRTIFCVSGDLDTLFDEGKIDESLYILMGTAEVRVPSLQACAADVPVLAQQVLTDVCREKGLASSPRFEKSARDFLRAYKWERNFEELSEMIRAVVDAKPGDVISAGALETAVKGSRTLSPRAKLEAYLSDAAADYIRAVSVLAGTEKQKVASFFGTDVGTVESKLK